MSDFRMRQDTMQHVFDGLLTLEEGRERCMQFRGELTEAEAFEEYKSFAIKNRAEIFHGDPLTGEEWPWPDWATEAAA